MRLEADNDALERNTVKISGLPEESNEDTDGIVLKVAQELDVPMTLSDIDRSHRVGKMDDNRAGGGRRRSRDIIVKFATYNARQRLYIKRRDLRQTGNMNHVFINEDLTKKRSKLLYDARCLVRTKKLKSAYASDGKIFVRDEHDRRHLIKCDIDLSEFGDPTESRKDLARLVAFPLLFLIPLLVQVSVLALLSRVPYSAAACVEICLGAVDTVGFVAVPGCFLFLRNDISLYRSPLVEEALMRGNNPSFVNY